MLENDTEYGLQHGRRSALAVCDSDIIGRIYRGVAELLATGKYRGGGGGALPSYQPATRPPPAPSGGIMAAGQHINA